MLSESDLERLANFYSPKNPQDFIDTIQTILNVTVAAEMYLASNVTEPLSGSFNLRQATADLQLKDGTVVHLDRGFYTDPEDSRQHFNIVSIYTPDKQGFGLNNLPESYRLAELAQIVAPRSQSIFPQGLDNNFNVFRP